MQELLQSYILTKKAFEKEIAKLLKKDQEFANAYPHATKLLEDKNMFRRYLIQHAAAAYNLIKHLHPDIETMVPDVYTADQSDQETAEPLTKEQLKEIYEG